MTLKILFSAAYDTRSNTGITGFIKCLVPPLSRLCDLTVLTPDPELFADCCATIPIPNWVRTHPGRVLWTFTRLPRFCARAYDLVLCATPAAPVGVPIPVIAVIHDLTPLVMNRYHRLKDKLPFWVGIQSLRWAAAVVTVSENTKRDLIARFPKLMSSAVQVIYEGPCVTPTADAAEFARQFMPYILYVGGHAPHKNVPRLIAAFARLRIIEGLKLVIVGWGKPSLVARTRAAVRLHQLADRVILLSNDLTNAQLSSLYRNCQLFVYPSLYEGFGLPVLEAMAHGAPVACSNTSSLPEVGGAAVRYFNPHSVTDIASKLKKLLTDESLRLRLSQAGLAQAARFSWEETAQRLLRVTTALAR